MYIYIIKEKKEEKEVEVRKHVPGPNCTKRNILFAFVFTQITSKCIQ